jgi:hypothetical protein
MHLILQYPNGRRADALLLSRGERFMRVTLRGRNDTLELRKVSGCWVDEEGNVVSIEAILAMPHQGGRQTNTKYTTTAETAKTASAAARSSTAGRIN